MLALLLLRGAFFALRVGLLGRGGKWPSVGAGSAEEPGAFMSPGATRVHPAPLQPGPLQPGPLQPGPSMREWAAWEGGVPAQAQHDRVAAGGREWRGAPMY